MNLYKIEFPEWDGWDVYDSAIVAAESEDIARTIHPDGELPHITGRIANELYDDWPTDPTKITVTYLSEAKAGTTEGVILASFNAG